MVGWGGGCLAARNSPATLLLSDQKSQRLEGAKCSQFLGVWRLGFWFFLFFRRWLILDAQQVGGFAAESAKLFIVRPVFLHLLGPPLIPPAPPASLPSFPIRPGHDKP